MYLARAHRGGQNDTLSSPRTVSGTSTDPGARSLRREVIPDTRRPHALRGEMNPPAGRPPDPPLHLLLPILMRHRIHHRTMFLHLLRFPHVSHHFSLLPDTARSIVAHTTMSLIRHCHPSLIPVIEKKMPLGMGTADGATSLGPTRIAERWMLFD